MRDTRTRRSPRRFVTCVRVIEADLSLSCLAGWGISRALSSGFSSRLCWKWPRKWRPVPPACPHLQPPAGEEAHLLRGPVKQPGQGRAAQTTVCKPRAAAEQVTTTLKHSVTCFLSPFLITLNGSPHLLCDVCCVYVSFHFETSFLKTVDLPSPAAVSSRTRSISESESSFNLPSSFSAPTFLKSIYQGSLGSLSSLADSGTLKRWEGILRGPTPIRIRPTCISQGQRGWVGEWARTF